MEYTLWEPRQRVENYRVPVSLEEFTVMIKHHKPANIFVKHWSSENPLYTLSHYTEQGVKVQVSSNSGGKPKHVSYEGLYKLIKNDLTDASFEAEKPVYDAEEARQRMKAALKLAKEKLGYEYTEGAQRLLVQKIFFSCEATADLIKNSGIKETIVDSIIPGIESLLSKMTAAFEKKAP